ncbi:MAG TPA: hypothetical protein VLT92_00790 [Burkholderiales bacterium]|nr:hypothetical protein [Burkholderiales bacterium]
MHVHLRLALALAAVSAMAACQTIGPGSIQRDRMDYAAAISDSWKEQALLNIIKLRYFDTPVFLDVASVISSYTLQSQIDVAARIFPNSPPDTFRNFGATGLYTDRPTISYAPVTGEKFVNNLLRPIPPQAIFAMIQAGHQADYILQAAVRAINDVYNYSAAPARARREDPTFHFVIRAFRRIQQAGALGVRIEKRGGAEVTLIFFRENAGEEVAKDIRRLKEALGIRPDSKEIRLDFGALRHGENEITLLTRSMMEMLVELSAGIDVPREHLAEGRARAMPESVATAGQGAGPLARIHSGSEPPADAYVAVRYRNYWFWVDDRDLVSKRTFTFLRIFSSIAETGNVPQVPIITIPAN